MVLCIFYTHIRVAALTRGRGSAVSGDAWNLVAASLCTLGTGVGTAALVATYLAAPTDVNLLLECLGGLIATMGGGAWVTAAAIAVRRH